MLGWWSCGELQTPRSEDVQLESPMPQDLQLQGSQSSTGKSLPTLCPSANRALSESRVLIRDAEVMNIDLSYAQKGGSRVLWPVSFFSKLKSLI